MKNYILSELLSSKNPNNNLSTKKVKLIIKEGDRVIEFEKEKTYFGRSRINIINFIMSLLFEILKFINL